ncbi:hypothetical protein A6R68_22915 [Neotoma lepida]|uniref:Uncharacterized protein n=1 Tax=Neotoma lepida TaxID=56216 RepID=A0A1A6HZB9_NEOLE|nr:hypothetical protein A6R68_22915 [Neotoma lepida]
MATSCSLSGCSTFLEDLSESLIGSLDISLSWILLNTNARKMRTPSDDREEVMDQDPQLSSPGFCDS